MKNNRIYLADVFDFLQELEDNTVDLVIADPPYNMKKADWDTFRTEQDYFEFTLKWIDAMLPKCKPTASIYLFNNAYNSAIILHTLRQRRIVFRNWITWYKKDGFSSTRRRYVNAQETILFYTMSDDYTFNYDDIRIPYASIERIACAAKKGILKEGKRWYPNEKGKLCNDVWEITSQRHKVKVNGKIIKPLHPTIKPDEMIDRMIRASSDENDLVLDLFSGSGTTSRIAKQLNRNFVGCEMNREYVKIITNNGVDYDEL
ncbi:MAG: site-specific DNA-methyltransferase [Bacteroidales bacterium]|nr:site-specific DNA-methyltransferase [Bacteroidales bacterium]